MTCCKYLYRFYLQLGKYQGKGPNHQVGLAMKENLIFEVKFKIHTERYLSGSTEI